MDLNTPGKVTLGCDQLRQTVVQLGAVLTLRAAAPTAHCCSSFSGAMSAVCSQMPGGHRGQTL